MEKLADPSDAPSGLYGFGARRDPGSPSAAPGATSFVPDGTLETRRVRKTPSSQQRLRVAPRAPRTLQIVRGVRGKYSIAPKPISSREPHELREQ